MPATGSPEARRRAALREGDGGSHAIATPGRLRHTVTIVERVISGAWQDGFIHAGNLAYMTMLALFPFFIALAAIFSAIGEQGQLGASIDAVLTAMPPRVAGVIAPVAHDVAAARHGWLLWVGGLLGIWTASSLVETLRDILRRAYGMPRMRKFWKSRALSSAVIFGSVLLVLVALSAQVLVSTLQEILLTWFPRVNEFIWQILFTRAIAAAVLFGSIYAVFRLLTPRRYQPRRYPKWPGALFVTAWWLAVSTALPRVLHSFFTADLTYGSFAGVMIALFFFWLVGLGMVVGAELNAALAESPEERDMLARTTPNNGALD